MKIEVIIQKLDGVSQESTEVVDCIKLTPENDIEAKYLESMHRTGIISRAELLPGKLVIEKGRCSNIK